MAQTVYKSQKEIYVFASKQFGGIKALKNVLDSDNTSLEKAVKEVVDEALGSVPSDYSVVDINVNTAEINGPVINVIVKAVKEG